MLADVLRFTLHLRSIVEIYTIIGHEVLWDNRPKNLFRYTERRVDR